MKPTETQDLHGELYRELKRAICDYFDAYRIGFKGQWASNPKSVEDAKRLLRKQCQRIIDGI